MMKVIRFGNHFNLLRAAAIGKRGPVKCAYAKLNGIASCYHKYIPPPGPPPKIPNHPPDDDGGDGNKNNNMFPWLALVCFVIIIVSELDVLNRKQTYCNENEIYTKRWRYTKEF